VVRFHCILNRGGVESQKKGKGSDHLMSSTGKRKYSGGRFGATGSFKIRKRKLRKGDHRELCRGEHRSSLTRSPRVRKRGERKGGEEKPRAKGEFHEERLGPSSKKEEKTY